MKKRLLWTMLFLGILTLLAAVNLLWYDYKQRGWYKELIDKRSQQSTDTTTIAFIAATVHPSIITSQPNQAD